MFYKLFLYIKQVYADDEWTTKTKTDLIAARNACVTKLSVPEDALAKYKSWNFPDDDLTRAYITCIFKEFGLFCDHEGFHVDRLVFTREKFNQKSKIKFYYQFGASI